MVRLMMHLLVNLFVGQTAIKNNSESCIGGVIGTHRSGLVYYVVGLCALFKGLNDCLSEVNTQQ